MTELGAPLGDGDLALRPLVEAHRADLKAACAKDLAIWPIYSTSYDPDHFDAQFDDLIARPGAYPFAILQAGRLVGMTAFLNHLPARQTVEIGNSYIIPSTRPDITSLHAPLQPSASAAAPPSD